MAKWIATILGVMLIVTNGLWLYAAIDLMVTEKYRQLDESAKDRSVDALRSLTEYYVTGTPKAEMMELLETRFPDDVIFEKEGAIHGPGVSFELNSDGGIKGVEVW